MKIGSTTSILCVFSVVTLTLLCGCGKSAQEETSLLPTLETAVVDIEGADMKATPLLETDYLLLYFSAHWCPPCRTFTPKFVAFYNAHGGGNLFHALLVSSDKSDEKMFAYMRETKMPWPAIRFDSASAASLKETYSGDGIPRLVLVNPEGEVIADSFEGKKYLGPQHVLNYLQKQLGIVDSNPTIVKPKPSSGEKFTARFTLNGLAKRGDQNIAIINENVASVGSEIESGVVVEEITGDYADLSFGGKRYRLYPPETTGTSAPPKNP